MRAKISDSKTPASARRTPVVGSKAMKRSSPASQQCTAIVQADIAVTATVAEGQNLLRAGLDGIARLPRVKLRCRTDG